MTAAPFWQLLLYVVDQDDLTRKENVKNRKTFTKSDEENATLLK